MLTGVDDLELQDQSLSLAQPSMAAIYFLCFAKPLRQAIFCFK